MFKTVFKNVWNCSQDMFKTVFLDMFKTIFKTCLKQFSRQV